MIVRDEVEKFKKEEISVRGDIVSLDDIARKRGVILESVRTALEGFKASGYARVGDLFLSNNKLEEIDEKLRGVQTPTGALQVIEGCGVKGLIREFGPQIELIAGSTSFGPYMLA